MVMKKEAAIKVMVLIVSCLIFITCSNGMDAVLARTTKDPFEEIPKVLSFNGDRSIIISWARDEAADEYCLYRAKDTPYPNYELIYQGFHTEYHDNNFSVVDENYRYLYRLGKRRGKKLFVDLTTRRKAGMGVVQVSRRDSHEPNDDQKHATVLSTIRLEANSWLYGSNNFDAITLFDEDWYCVEIPANWTARVKLIEINTVPDAAHFYIEVVGSSPQPFVSNHWVDIINNTNHSNSFYFRIYPNYSTFRMDYQDDINNLAGPQGGYGAFISYTIEVINFFPNTN